MGCGPSVDRDLGSSPPAKSKEASTYDRRKTPAPPEFGLTSADDASSSADVSRAFDSPPTTSSGLGGASDAARPEPASAQLADAVAELSACINELDTMVLQQRKQLPSHGPQIVAGLRALAAAADNSQRHAALALAHCRLVRLAVGDLLSAGRCGNLDRVVQQQATRDLEQALLASWSLLELLTDAGAYTAAALSRFATAFTMRLAPYSSTGIEDARNIPASIRSADGFTDLPTAAAASGAMLAAAVQGINAHVVLGNALGGGVATAGGGAGSAAALQQAQKELGMAQSGLAEAVAALRRGVEEGSGAPLPQPQPKQPDPATAEDGEQGSQHAMAIDGAAAGRSTDDAAAVLGLLRAFMDKRRVLGRGGGGASNRANNGSQGGGGGDSGGAAAACTNAFVAAADNAVDLHLPTAVAAAAEALEHMQEAAQDCPQQRWLLLRQPSPNVGADEGRGAGGTDCIGGNGAGVTSSETVGGSGAPAASLGAGYRLVLAPLLQPLPSALEPLVSSSLTPAPPPQRPCTAQRPSTMPRHCMAFVPRVVRRAVLGHMETVRGHVCNFQPRFRVRVPELSAAPPAAGAAAAGAAPAGAAAGAGELGGGQACGGEAGGCFVVCGGHAAHFDGYVHLVEPLE